MLGTTETMMGGTTMGTMHGTTSMMSRTIGALADPSTGTTTGMMGSTSRDAMGR